ncbi:hypothetical protein WT26_22040 [Burkholderia cepacia]|uniref:Uncharacterized protein n=2 Tax=Burkholderia cepacia complex TaxID=87882 RepID=A0A1B4PXL9_BURCE|nr:hypothetical protein WT26_22040 [Burkholderia cepacia]AOK25451.1 hypothetical protein WK67_21955 [Burkholderia ubonensis]
MARKLFDCVLHASADEYFLASRQLRYGADSCRLRGDATEEEVTHAVCEAELVRGRERLATAGVLAPVDLAVGDGARQEGRKLALNPASVRSALRKLVRAEPFIVMTMQPGPRSRHGLAQLGSRHLGMLADVCEPLSTVAVSLVAIDL